MKTLIIPIFTLLFCFNALAQRDGRMQERIKAQKVAFITERLDLSSSEAQQFWPIYNAFEDKTEAIRQNDLMSVRQAMRKGNLSDSESQSILNQFMAAEEKLYNAKKQLVTDLKKVIPSQKIIALKVAEDAFRQKLLKIMQQRKDRLQNRKN